jgi:glycosyltransferase involved in cell wall biosynthesis
MINIRNETIKDTILYKPIINELFSRNETINIKNIQEEILMYKNNIINVSFDNKKDFYERDNPKITLIITIYNQREFIYKIYSCIQNQSFKDIEIIFIDDNSIDNSTNVINTLMKEDKRIQYIKNIINKGQFYSRYVGIKMAKGDYILVIDPDDLLLNNILNKSYVLAKNYDLDIVQYYHLKGNFTNNVIRKMNFFGFFYNEQIKNIFFKCSYRYLWDKLIKRKVFIESIEFIKEKYRNSRIIIHNDEVACYCVFRVAKSYGVLEQIGYFYNRENPNSITKFNFVPANINGRFHSLFTIMEFYYEQSDNNTYEKTMGGYNFFKSRIRYIYLKKIQYLTSGFNYINNILDLYLNSSFFNYNQKYNLKIFKYMINKQKLKILNSINI